MDTHEILRREAERLRASGVLGRSRLRRLFDYLLTASVEDRSPKEIAIAMDVFGKTASFDVSQDALVRVYIHNLRRALDEFYAGQTDPGVIALGIPRGEYKLVPRPASEPTPASDPDDVPDDRPGRWRGVLLGAVLGAAVVLVAVGVRLATAPRNALEAVRANPLWSGILADDRPILVIVGDYYFIGDLDEDMEVKRLVREFDVNSKDDLDRYIERHPEVVNRYQDMGLRYLPTATAFALHDVLPVLMEGNRSVSVSLMSDVKPGSFKSANIVYIGYLSGMGAIQDLAFAASRFRIGQSYDELIDKRTNQAYVSQAASHSLMGFARSASASGASPAYRDYGFFSSFRGPDGNTIIIIAGTRDEGVQQTAEAFTDPKRLEEFARQVDTKPPFEAVLEVNALDGVNLTGKLVSESSTAAGAGPGAVPPKDVAPPHR